MKKQNYRLWKFFRNIAIFILIFIAIYVSAMWVLNKSTMLKVYRVSSNTSNNCTINTYSDYVVSMKKLVIEPYAEDTQYILDLKGTYSKVSVSTYNSSESQWYERDIIELGNNQYAINPLPILYWRRDHTVTYCINIENGDDIQKYYFTVK